MARPPRIDYPGAIHHVMNRGADHQIIFRNDDDRELFLTLWAQAVTRFGIVVLSFCLMNNHFHVLVESPNAQLSRTLQFVARSYTQQFNYHHGRDGALFRGRFHSILVDSEVYLERAARYVELNPAAAGLLTLAELHRYEWSSFQFYTGHRPTPAWLSSDQILDRFTNQEQFDRFVRSGMTDNELNTFYNGRLQTGRVLGNQAFVDRIRSRLVDGPPIVAGVPDVGFDEIDAVVRATVQCHDEELRHSTRGRPNHARGCAVDIAHLLTGSTLQALADHYRFSSVHTVNSAIRSSRRSTDPRRLALRSAVLGALGRSADGLPTREM